MDRRFRHFLAIDWSGAQGPRQKGIALALAERGGGTPRLLPAEGGWSREGVLHYLRDGLPADTLVGLDLGMSLPFADCGAFFPGWSESPADAHGLWALVERISEDDPHLSVQSFVDHPQASRFFRRHGGREGAQFRCDGAAHGRGRFRVTEEMQARQGCKPYSNFNLIGAAQVGKSSLTGMRVLHALKGTLPVWPVDPLPPAGSVVVEIYTTIAAMAAKRRASSSKIRDHAALAEALAALGSPAAPGSGPIDDHSADALITAAWLRASAARPELWRPAAMTDHIAQTEGWTFGVA
ncbi:conserved hypothetical protein [Altererythrobacter sp. B11]|uniref:hypothetical protein n=1 Tax=Altererythrobacter sp. B11 TaxID=2060312 RepID=UPI000DC71DDC|nr:hypothetical protein [Altererythrobacter sp. B11]BBC74088.1 conserved hypothetical protein [Altererythrobacter sp. B11]